MAPDIARVRLDRHRHHAALPAEHDARRRHPAGRDAATPGQAARDSLFGHQHLDLAPGVQPVPAGAALGDQGQIPGQQRDHHARGLHRICRDAGGTDCDPDRAERADLK